MIPFEFSRERNDQVLGWLAENCPMCGEARAFLCYRSLRAFRVFGAKIDEQVISVGVECCFCRTAFALPAGTEPQVDSEWQPEAGLQVLVDRTNPSLGTVQRRGEPRTEALLALLKSLENQQGNFIELLENTSGRDVAIGALLGGIVFALLGNLLVYLGPHREDLWSTAVFFGICPPGMAVGGIVGGIFGGIRIARKAIVEGLKQTMGLFKIRCSQLQEQLMREPNTLRRAASIVETACRERK